MRFLCVSDVHGNLGALAAVLATAEKRAFSKLFVAGDIVFSGLADDAHTQPAETWRRLNAAGAVLVQGVTDRALALLDPEGISATTEHERRMLARLRRLPAQHRVTLEDGGELVMVHGSPADASEAISHDMTDDEILALLGDDPADIVLCGMSHVPFDRVVADVRIIGLGSIGEAPDGVEPRAMPTVAHATWIESTPTGIMVEQISVPLDSASPMR